MAIPEKACPSNTTLVRGANLAVYPKGSSDPLALISKFRSAAIPVQINENTVELKDGSIDAPIYLQNLKKTNTPAVAELLVRLSDGSIAAWDIGNVNGEKILVIKDGQITAQDKYSSDLFDGSICEETDCSNVDSTLGVKQRVVVCPGQPDKVMWQICRIPKCCCTAEDIESITGQ